jgi:hypothetical protein
LPNGRDAPESDQIATLHYVTLWAIRDQSAAQQFGEAKLRRVAGFDRARPNGSGHSVVS